LATSSGARLAPGAVRSRPPISSNVGVLIRGNSWITGWVKTISEVCAWFQATRSLPSPAYMPANMATQRSYSGFQLPL